MSQESYLTLISQEIYLAISPWYLTIISPETFLSQISQETYLTVISRETFFTLINREIYLANSLWYLSSYLRKLSYWDISGKPSLLWYLTVISAEIYPLMIFLETNFTVVSFVMVFISLLAKYATHFVLFCFCFCVFVLFSRFSSLYIIIFDPTFTKCFNSVRLLVWIYIAMRYSTSHILLCLPVRIPWRRCSLITRFPFLLAFRAFVGIYHESFLLQVVHFTELIWGRGLISS